MSGAGFLPENILSALRKALGLADLHVELRAEWSSQTAEHRQQIRSHIFKNIEARSEVLDLGAPPKLSRGGISISHNRSLGGIAWSKDVAALGFDLEEEGRLNSENLARFSSAAERETCPFPGALWTAKEAVFKALGGKDQPSVVGQIQIGNWQSVGKDLFSFKILSVKGKSEFSDWLGVVHGWDADGKKMTLALVAPNSLKGER